MPRLGSQQGPTNVPLYGATYVGIDPGAGGGLAVISPLSTTREVKIQAVAMPETERDVWDWFLSVGSSVQFAVIEQVSGYIGEGQPGSAMFKFGMSYGMLRAFLVAARIPFELATPQKWQGSLGVPKRKKEETKTEWKNRLKAHAQRLFPSTKVTLAVADAMLICEYARRLHQGLLK